VRQTAGKQLVRMRVGLVSRLFYHYETSPVGPFLVAGAETVLHFTGFTTGHQQRFPGESWRQDSHPLRFAIDPLRRYFAGDPVDFEIELAMVGSQFQQYVWTYLQSIPFGGVKQSGLLREGSRIGMEAFSALKYVCSDTSWDIG